MIHPAGERWGEIRSVEACLRVPGLNACSRVWTGYASGFDDMVAIFRQLATDWRGWPRGANL
jgi:hypothetical protein